MSLISGRGVSCIGGKENFPHTPLSIKYIFCLGLFSDVLHTSTFKSKSLVFTIILAIVILYVLSIYSIMFEKEITIGQNHVRPAGRYSDYQIVDTEGNN